MAEEYEQFKLYAALVQDLQISCISAYSSSASMKLFIAPRAFCLVTGNLVDSTAPAFGPHFRNPHSLMWIQDAHNDWHTDSDELIQFLGSLKQYILYKLAANTSLSSVSLSFEDTA